MQLPEGSEVKKTCFISILMCLVQLCTSVITVPELSGPLLINEFMAGNRASEYVDEYGDSDDWIELYNCGTMPVQTEEYMLSDDSLRLNRFVLPDTLLPAGSHLLIWVDDDPQQGKWHAPFMLSAEKGEEIILSTRDNHIVDRIQFFPGNRNPVARVPDESYGRLHDGDTLWGQQITPPPGSANTGGRVQP